MGTAIVVKNTKPRTNTDSISSQEKDVSSEEAPALIGARQLSLFTGIVVVLAVAVWLSWNANIWVDSYEAVRGFLRGWLGRVAAGTVIFGFAWLIVTALIYRSIPPCEDNELPEVTVIVPAYNEGRQVLETLRSIAQSDYPPEKLQIVAVDDGSRDDTWKWMIRASTEMAPRIELIRLAKNSGKRHALYQGFQQARGEVLITIDSDSQVEKATLRHMVSPFVKDPRVGGVAGNVRVLNTHEGFIPKILDVSFTYSFDFVRAGQSVVKTVMCTPGALSAYRRSVVQDYLPRWLNQKFMGRSANIGEDRALTNIILREGYHVLFQREAVVYTNVPVKYKGLCCMLLRWGRSNIRETIVMAGFIFTKFRKESATGARINFLLSAFRLSIGEIFKLLGLTAIILYPLPMAVNMAASATTASLLPALVHRRRRGGYSFLWSLPYSFFWVFTLSWVSLYALITPHKNGWLTRGLHEVQTEADVHVSRPRTALSPESVAALIQPNTASVAVPVQVAASAAQRGRTWRH